MKMWVKKMNKRLAAISYTVLGGKPDELVASFRYDQISGVEAHKGRLASTVTLAFHDGIPASFRSAAYGQAGAFCSSAGDKSRFARPWRGKTTKSCDK